MTMQWIAPAKVMILGAVDLYSALGHTEQLTRAALEVLASAARRSPEGRCALRCERAAI